MRVAISIAIVVWAISAGTAYSSAQAVFQRDILALFSGAEEQNLAGSRIHAMVEMPLNHLGYRVTYHDIDKGLPPSSEDSQFFAVVTWFEDAVLPSAYGEWVDRLVKAGKRFVIFGDPDGRAEASQAARSLLSALGLEETGDHVQVTYGLEPQATSPTMVGFEAPLDVVIPPFPVYRAIGEGVQVRFGLRGQTIPGNTAVLVATGPRGGFAASGFITRTTAHEPRSRWFIDPFEFLGAALGRGSVPVPDTTTLAGRRLYFSHIDGDGWNNVSEIEAYRDDPKISAEVILREAIEPYPDLPVTVGVIGADVDPELGGHEDAARVARALFALPQVEVASHTYTHPYRWQFFENYDRSAELAEIERRKTGGRPPGLLDRIRYRFAGKAITPDYAHGVADGGEETGTETDPPRTFDQKPFDLHNETEGSLRLAESLAPAGKKAELYLWSGDTNPFEAAIEAVRIAGSLNMNGGDSRFDSAYPSMIYVPPLSRAVGAERQIYAANSNESAYTNLWTGPFYGFRQLQETIRLTGSPRRLKPVNVYYHMYTGEKRAGLTALLHHLDWARHAQIIPVKASQYVEIANDFFEVAITETGPLRWRIADRGTLQTFRFDDADQLAIDLDRSRGVLGANRLGSALYVALEPTEAAPIIAAVELSGETRPAAISQSGRPYLLDSRQSVESWRTADCNMSARIDGFGRLEMTWAGVEPGIYQIAAHHAETGIMAWSARSRVTESGRLRIAADTDVGFPTRLSVTCSNQAESTG